ncbi:hypothetical protein DC498_19125 [Terrimonas sp.]|uniref:hypothetical protein n=1 Tax=Terrimonas sp. TaxID=1914338 RepID=UPI000D51AA83|nr:hypothetical protein [Terrimonas sp.]PVD50540.1 hypothetical protein DC498_19125 [Terrimonas sp.]
MLIFLVKNRIVLCGFLNAFFFFLFFLFLKPLYSSGDDVFCLYFLSGGFGFAPTEIVNYNHALNPILTLPVKYLFVLAPNINWYTLLLIIFHFIATTIIFVQITNQISYWKSVLAYIAIFCVVEGQFLINLSFSNTSIVLTWAALILGLTIIHEQAPIRKYILCIAMFVFASLFRIHTMFPFIVIIIPFFFLNKNIHFYRIFGLALITTTIVFSLNRWHQYYYERNIPGWIGKEQYQQSLYKYYNKEGLYNVNVQKWKIEAELIKYSIHFDSNFLSLEKLNKMYVDLNAESTFSDSFFDFNSIKWLLINNRIYFFAFILFLIYVRNKRLQVVSLLSFVLLCGGIVFLLLNMKLPAYIIPGAVAVICFSIFLTNSNDWTGLSPLRKLVQTLLILFLIFWGCVRLCKVSLDNEQKNNQFKNAFNEIAKHRSTLFLVQDFGFPFDYFSVFDVPSKYPLNNIVLAWQFPEEMGMKILHLNGLKSIKDIPYSDKVLFWGKPVQALLDYFEITTGKKYCFSEPLKEFKYGEVRRLETCKLIK